MKHLLYVLICAAGLTLFWTCTKKITGDSINVLAPSNNAITKSNAVTFWWDPLDGADNYELQIVQPNFAAVQTLIADTTVTNNKITLNLVPGTYQWRIKGINGGGSTKFSILNLTVDTTSNLSAQLVVPIGPPSGFVTSSTSVTFSWNSVPAANQYQIQINGDQPVEISGTVYTGTFAAGSYSWQVKALNNFSFSQYNNPRIFKIDQTVPNAPTNLLISSAIVASSKVTDTLSWHRNSPDVSYDSLYFYTDVGLTILGYSGTQTTTKINVGHFLPPPSGTPTVAYWWRVKSIDSVGNRSFFSTAAAFTLTP